MLAYHTESIENKIIFVCNYSAFLAWTWSNRGLSFPFGVLICTLASIEHRKSNDSLIWYHCTSVKFRTETNHFHEENSTAAAWLGEFEDDFLDMFSATYINTAVQASARFRNRRKNLTKVKLLYGFVAAAVKSQCTVTHLLFLCSRNI